MNALASTAQHISETRAVDRRVERAPLLRLDAVMLLLVAAILLLGLIMVTSASVTAAARESGDPFAYLERQLVLVAAGLVLAAAVFTIPISIIERIALPLLITAVVLLLLVLIPGLGHVVKGGRRWLRLPGINFQVSEAARGHAVLDQHP